jgi:hypothetical protein
MVVDGRRGGRAVGIDAERIGIIHTARLDTLEVWAAPGGQLRIRVWDGRLGVRAELVMDAAGAAALVELASHGRDRLAMAPEEPVEEPEPNGREAGGAALVERAQELAQRASGRFPA